VKAVVDKEPARPSDAVSQTESGAARATTNALRRATTPDRLHRALRGDLDTIVAKALKKEPRERYSSVAALAEDLRRYLRNQPITARPDTFTYRAAKFVRRHRLPVLLASLAVAATIAGALGTMVQARTARSQRDFALRQLVRAERINDLNQLLLTDVAPSGKMLTANQLLDHEKQIIEREHYDNAANHVEMLLSIGSQYSGEEENEKALAVLSQAYQLSRQLHEPSTRARASCELASASIPGGELVRAESLIQEGLRELPNQPQYELDRVSCLVSGSETAFRNGNASHAVARAEAADRALKGAPVQPPVEELDVSTALASAYGAAGRFREANSSFERASLQMTNLGYDETQKAVKLYNDWGLTLFDAGRPLEAEKAYRRAIQISRSDQTEDSVLPTLLHNYSTTLRELGRLDEAADYAGRAHQKALQDGNQILAVQTALQQARIYRDQHDFARATAILAEIEPKMKQALPPGHYAFAVLAHDKAGLAREQGQGAKALELSNQAIAIDEASIKAGGQGASYLPTFLTRRSAIELDAGNSDRAVADAARALELLRSTMEPGTLSSTLGRTNLALARALQAQGKVEEARAAFQSAAENLQATIGRDHPDTRAALQSAHSDNQHSQLAAGNAKS
jgi:tetratricopeptide (TPR) repeat protein